MCARLLARLLCMSTALLVVSHFIMCYFGAHAIGRQSDQQCSGTKGIAPCKNAALFQQRHLLTAMFTWARCGMGDRTLAAPWFATKASHQNQGVQLCNASLQEALSLEAVLLKPQMCIPGSEYTGAKAEPSAVAEHTLHVMRRQAPGPLHTFHCGEPHLQPELLRS